MPVELEALQRRQILEPEKEKQLRSTIPILQEIKNNVSCKVQEQYEQNPYPRWVNLQLSPISKSISTHTQKLKLRISNLGIDEIDTPQILIAGCGTGEHPIATASNYKNCNVLGIDLSLSSLTYAKRKTEELGFSNIEYMQADILDLTALDRKFDIIESGGVLHHMDDPMAGWKVLTDCLKTGGLMRIGLYSESARKYIVQIHDEIEQSNIESSHDAMKSFRNKIVNSEEEHHKWIVMSSDFYSMSTFRDLLFHVQEHRFTIPQIEVSLTQLGLAFCGFEHPTIVQKFQSRNPTENALYDLEKWDNFEKEKPRIFASMYQFWCQKI
jgi:2-polyprenyl-3-methyl-5-hydroxy-6-metoxy-1,4-benzoquinol methylase